MTAAAWPASLLVSTPKDGMAPAYLRPRETAADPPGIGGNVETRARTLGSGTESPRFKTTQQGPGLRQVHKDTPTRKA